MRNLDISLKTHMRVCAHADTIGKCLVPLTCEIFFGNNGVIATYKGHAY